MSENVLGRLTDREMQVAEKIAEGLASRDIAEQLGIPVDAVQHRMLSIFDKLGISNRLELILLVHKKGRGGKLP